MPESCWRAIRTREMHIGFRYSFFFQIWGKNSNIQTDFQKIHLKESDTPNLLALCVFRLDLIELVGDVPALPAEELQRFLCALEVALGHQEDWRPGERRG